MHYCTFESRPGNIVGLKLLILSLEEHASNFVHHVFLPEIPPAFAGWVERHASQVVLQEMRPDARGWAVKAEVLLSMLEDVQEIVWLDSDILVIDDPGRFFRALAPATLVVAQDFYKPFDPDSGYATAWGYERVRALEYELNTCVLRVTEAHRRLLQQWKENVTSDLFIGYQQMKGVDRPRAFFGAQQTLEGLLTSHLDGFAEIPVAFVKTGVDIIHDHRHFYSYASRDRMRNGLGLQHPAFVHCLTLRPWMDDWRSMRQEWMQEAMQFKPYVRMAERYRHQLEEDVSDWMDHRTTFGRICQAATLNNPHLQGLGMWLLERYRRYATEGSTTKRA